LHYKTRTIFKNPQHFEVLGENGLKYFEDFGKTSQKHFEEMKINILFAL